MPRSRRITPAGQPFHVVNRGTEGRQLFFESLEYRQFIDLLTEAKARYPVHLYGYCVMPNHFHLVLSPVQDAAVSAFMRWLTGCHACHLRSDTRTVGQGHVYQHRYWAGPIGSEKHFLNVVRYVESNALRAKLVERAEQWRWGSLWERTANQRRLVDLAPVALPDDWVAIVNTPQAPEELEIVRQAKRLGRPRKRGQTPFMTSR